MKKIFIIIVVVFAIVCCKSKEEDVTTPSTNKEQNDVPSDVQQVRFVVNGLHVNVGSMGGMNAQERKSKNKVVDPESAEVSELWIMEGSEVICHQDDSDNDFGSPIISMTSGKHILTFIGSGKDGQKVVDGVWSADRISDTYGCVDTFNVYSGMDVQQVIMSHANYQLKWESNDVVIKDAKSITITISGHHKKIKNGLNSADDGSDYVFSYNCSERTGNKLEITLSGFCTLYNTVDSVVTTMVINGSDKELFRHSTIAPVITNRPTIVRGTLFGSTQSSIRVNNSWLEEYEIVL